MKWLKIVIFSLCALIFFVWFRINKTQKEAPKGIADTMRGILPGTTRRSYSSEEQYMNGDYSDSRGYVSSKRR
ncbi:hypothetical protein [Capnocytophaga canis]|uniref:Uncharacterized protein n=1 Tax=Capnocytophaga canis TaxID=1848903 RepID=A0A0B7IJ47_9FLAO|nr:hypothetical protein [Capnocytophaga canis]CEN51920.1 hypothetical protein CCAND93_20040 [Capnocytophaga canis]